MSFNNESTTDKTQLFRDLVDEKIPKRVPIMSSISVEFSFQYSGFDLAESLWEPRLLETALDKVAQDFVTDTAPFSVGRHPYFYEILGSKPFIMSSSGYMQHPDVVGLLPEEYDELIAAPYNCMVEKVLPRLYTELDTKSSMKAALILAKAIKADCDETNKVAPVKRKINSKYGYAEFPSPESRGRTEAPFDFLADLLRSFKGIALDIRRYPEKVMAACESILPLLIMAGTPLVPSKYGYTSIPLHMATYMREKDFEKFYWPTFKQIVEALRVKGQGVHLFLEHDWMRYLDYLYDLPKNTFMRFEFGDPKTIKDKLGKKHILTGLYPVSLLQSGSKQQCIDKAKELLDIMAPGGKYWFNTDKVILNCDTEGNTAKNLREVLEYVYLNGKYDSYNPTYSKPIAEIPAESVNTAFDPGSDYFMIWQNYKKKHPPVKESLEPIIKDKMKKYEEVMFNYVINMLMN